MSLTFEQFGQVLTGLQQLRPFAKGLDESGLMLAWISFPEEARLKLRQHHLSFAAAQLLLDPEPPKEVPVHLLLLRYLYRLENGAPNVRWGLKADLDSRMKLPTHFHPVTTSSAQRTLSESLVKLDGERHSPHGVLAGGGL